MEDNTLKIYDTEGIGEVQVTEDVLAIIAGLAATEVEGVESMAGGITNEIVAKLGKKNLAAGVKILYQEGKVFVNVSLVIKMGYNLPQGVDARNPQSIINGLVQTGQIGNGRVQQLMRMFGRR